MTTEKQVANLTKEQREQVEQKALQKAMGQVTALPQETQEAITLGKVFALSGLFPDLTSSAQAVVKILAGQELGFPPLYSMRNVFIIPGKGTRPPQVYVSAEAYGAKLRQAGVEFEPVEETAEQCTIKFTRRGQSHEVTYTMQQARKSGVVKEFGAWQERPEWMLYKQALRNGARQYYSDVIAGIEGVAEEVQEQVDKQADFNRPKCGVHGVAMRSSPSGHWYCPTLVDGKYCQYQVPKDSPQVDTETGEIIDAENGEFHNIETLPEPPDPKQVAQDTEELFGSLKSASPSPGGGVTPPPVQAQAPTAAAGSLPAARQPGHDNAAVPRPTGGTHNISGAQHAASPVASAPTGAVQGSEAPETSHGHPAASEQPAFRNWGDVAGEIMKLPGNKGKAAATARAIWDEVERRFEGVTVNSWMDVGLVTKTPADAFALAWGIAQSQSQILDK